MSGLNLEIWDQSCAFGCIDVTAFQSQFLKVSWAWYQIGGKTLGRLVISPPEGRIREQ